MLNKHAKGILLWVGGYQIRVIASRAPTLYVFVFSVCVSPVSAFCGLPFCVHVRRRFDSAMHSVRSP